MRVKRFGCEEMSRTCARLMRGFGRSSFTKNTFTMNDEVKARFAPHDLERYEKEQVIMVNKKNQEIGKTNIVMAHLTDNIMRKALPHRAFSVVLFDAEFNMLIQKRADTKPIFPSFWANACCSHPLKNIPLEDQTENALGVIKAAARRVPFELGITIEEDRFKLASIMLYKAVYDNTFTECEMDHILACQIDGIKPPIPFNPKEVQAIKWLSPKSYGYARTLTDLRTEKEKIAPWFDYMFEIGLEGWWQYFRERKEVITLFSDDEPIIHTSYKFN